ncbi:MAG: hypothetical protein D6819_05085 [Gammaproteobacteria bacterium]|nr:MAG: hypothetical protein D6819_05085 [Gammaproteobacteria bacterium]
MVRGALWALFAFPALAGAGQAGLMEHARQKAFLLNKQVIEQLDLLSKDARIVLEGKVKVGPGGKVEVVLERLEATPIEEGEIALPKGQYIRYMPFETMVLDHAPPSGFYGGGSALKKGRP